MESLRHEFTPKKLLPPALLAAVVAVLTGWFAHHKWFIDLQVYVLGARHAFRPDLYDVALGGADLPFTYPPFAAVVLYPLAQFPFEVTAAAFSAASFVALYVMTKLSVERAFSRTFSPWVVGAIAVGALVAEPVWATLSFGQVNLVIAALCLVDLLRRGRTRGALLGVAAGIKLTPLFFIAFLVLTRQFRAAMTATGVFLLTVALGFIVNPGAARTFWGSAVSDPSRVGARSYAGNQSLSGVVERVHGDSVPSVVLLLSQALVAVGALMAARWVDRRGEHFTAVLIAAFGMLAVSPVSWTHHWVWAVPAFFLILGRAGSRPVARGAAAVAWLACFSARSMWWPPYRDGRELDWSAFDKVVGDPYLIAAVVWVVCAVRAVRNAPDEERASTR